MNETVTWQTTVGEYGPLALPRKCQIMGDVRSGIDGGFVVALKVEPSFSDSNLVPPSVNETLVLISRAMGRSYSLKAEELGRVFSFDAPLLVRLYRALDSSILATGEFTRSQIQLLPRGALFRSRDDAMQYANGLGIANQEL